MSTHNIHFYIIIKRKNWIIAKCIFISAIERMSYGRFSHHPKTGLYNFDIFKPHFYIVKLGFTGMYFFFLILAQKHRLWVLTRTASTRRL